MTLPELVAQFVYARVAWGLVLAALLIAAWRHRRAVSSVQTGAVMLLSMGAMWLPGAASPAYWLGLALAQPSVMLAALCVASLRPSDSAHAREPVLAPIAPWVAALGAVLYVDALGWTHVEWYAAGAHAQFAPVAALVLGGLALAALRAPALRAVAGALLVAVFGFCVFRLPSGNLFDALLDPLLWLASVVLAASAGWRSLRIGNRKSAVR